jgi:hypothetical protein
MSVGMCAQNMLLDFLKIHPLVPLTVTSMTSPVKTQQFILLFSATVFGLKGQDQFEHNIKRVYIHSLYGI